MKSKHLRCILSILVCMTMVFTQMLPLSFADSISGAETEAAAAADEDTGEAADDSEAAADTDSEAAATADADSTEAADDSAELQEGTDEGTDEGTGEEEPTVDYNPGISWYLNDKTASTFEISTAEQLFGLAQLVNGTAVQKTSEDDAGTAVAAVNFSGKTIKLTADIDLGGEAWTPAGVNGSSKSFQGTFDGQGHKISGYSLETEITGTAAAYMGFFGYLRNATVRDFTLEGSAEVVRTEGGTTNLGGVAGYTYGKVTIDSVDVDIDWSDSNLACNTVNFGGIVGIMANTSASSHGYITDCTVDGVYDLEAETDARMGFIGGIVGETASSYVDISGCVSNLDITTYSANTEYYHGVGGIVGNIYSSYTYVYDCVNNGDIKGLGHYGRSYIGGILGCGKGSGYIYNCINNGDITAPPGQSKSVVTSYHQYAGGLAGYNYNVVVKNSVNTGNVIIPENTAYNSYYVGTLSGLSAGANCVNYGRVICKDYEADENDDISVLAQNTGTTTLDGSLFTAYDRSSSLDMIHNWETNTSAKSVGVFKSNGSVTPYADSVFSYDTDDLGELLNMYAVDNSPSAYYPYRLWVEVDGVYQPVGQEVMPAATPSVEASTEAISAVAGTDVVLTANISVGDYSDSRSTVTYQWYAADNALGNDAVALTGDGASGTLTSGSETVTYTLTADKYSDMYYFIKVTNALMYKTEDGSDITAQVAAAESDKLEIEFKVKGDTSFHGESAEAFESGTGTAEDPYIIKTPQQLRLMAVKAAENVVYRAAHYRLAADIDYNNARWSPVCQSTSAPFTGTLDGAGYEISNLVINTNNINSGLFSNTKNATIKDLTLSGSLTSTGSSGVSTGTYAGAFVGLAESSALEGLTNNMDIVAVNLDNNCGVGGIAGCVNVPNASSAKGIAFIKVANCVNNGDVTYKADTSVYTQSGSFYESYTGGIIGKGWQRLSTAGQLTNIYNCVNYGDIRSEKTNDGGKNIVLVTAGIISLNTKGYVINNCVNYGTYTAEGTYSAYSEVAVRALSAADYQGSNTLASQNNCYNLAAEGADVAAAKASLDSYAISNCATYPGIKCWTSDSKDASKLYPDGVTAVPAVAPAVALTVKSGDEDYAEKSALSVDAGTSVTLKASITAEKNSLGTESITYQWYKAAKDGVEGEPVTGAGATGTLSGLEGTVELTVTSAEYSNAYYYLKAVNTVTYPGDIVIYATATSSYCNITFKANDGVFRGEPAASITGEGTADSPYLISTPNELAYVSAQVNAGAEGYAEAYYKLAADINYQNAAYVPIGTENKPFKGHFDGNGKTVSNIKLTEDHRYTGFFGYMSGADVSNLTVKGAADITDYIETGIQYVGGIAGYAVSSALKDCTSEIAMVITETVADTQISYIGGVVGAITGTGAEINRCVSNGSITLNFNGTNANTLIGGVAATVLSGAALLNSYNTGDMSFVRNVDNANGIRTVTAGGVAAYVNGTGSSIRNCANTGNFTAVSNTEKTVAYWTNYYIGGIVGSINAGGTYLENCVSYGSLTCADDSIKYYSGVYSIIKNANAVVSYSYGYDAAGSQQIFNTSGSAGMWDRTTPTLTGNGYIDAATGNIVNADFSYNSMSVADSSKYVRNDAVRAATASAGYSDAYYALNGWAGENNTADALKYNKWEKLSDGSDVYVPSGAAEVSPFAATAAASALAVSIDDKSYGDIFAKNADIPELSPEVTGAGAADTKTTYTYSWYKSLYDTDDDRTLIAGANQLKYKPAAEGGRLYYSLELTALNGIYFTSASSNKVKITTESDNWIGDAADIEELEGFGTEAEPYIVDSPAILALIAQEYNKNAKATPSREIDTEDDNVGKAKPYVSAYYQVTDDIDMGGAYTMNPIGTTSFQGHFYGKKEDGGTPVIKGLYISGGLGTSSSKSHVGLFTEIAKEGVVENLIFENAKIVADFTKDTYAGIVAGVCYGTIRNITVSGLVTSKGTISSTVAMGGIAGSLGTNSTSFTPVIENCVNNATVKAYAASVDAGSLVPTGANVSSGGIAGRIYASAKGIIPEIRNCVNNGAITGFEQSGGDNGSMSGTGGITGKVYSISSAYNAALTGCVNTGAITGRYNVGGIAGIETYGTITDCYNTGAVASSLEKGSGEIRTGGIIGYQIFANSTVAIDGCYNAGHITSYNYTDESGEAHTTSGLLVGKTSKGSITDSYALAQDDMTTINKAVTSLGVVYEFDDNSEIVTAEKLKSTEAAVKLGDAYYQAADSYPVLEYQVAEADRCIISVKAADETSGTAYLTGGDIKQTKLNAVKGAELKFGAVGDLGYEVSSLSNGLSVLTPADGIYTLTADGSAELTAVLAKTSSYAVILTDYDGAAEGKALLIWRGEPADGQSVYLGDVQMLHASAFDTKTFTEDMTNAGHVTVDGEAEAAAAVSSYAVFVDADASLAELAAQIQIKTAADADVDYSDYDLNGDSSVDIFDAQLIWDIMNGSATVSASDLQRLQADFNKDGSLTVQDVLAVHKAILNKIAG